MWGGGASPTSLPFFPAHTLHPPNAAAGGQALARAAALHEGGAELERGLALAERAACDAHADQSSEVRAPRAPPLARSPRAPPLAAAMPARRVGVPGRAGR